MELRLNSWLPTSTIILPKHVWKDIAEPREYNDPRSLIGSGPFGFQEYDPVSQTVTLKANPSYFGGKPAVDIILWRHFKSFDSMLLSMLNGATDVVLDYYSPFPVTYAGAVESSMIRLQPAPDLGAPACLIFNLRKSPMNIRVFREAVACGLDYREVMDTAATGMASAAGRGFISPAFRFFKPGLGLLEQDMARAEHLLDTLGYIKGGDGVRKDSKGSEVSFDLLVQGGSRYPNLVRIAELLCRQLRRIGIGARPLVLDYSAADRRLFSEKDFDVCVARFMPLDILADSPGNMGTCSDPRLLSLAEAFYSARNEEEMREAAWALQDYYAEELPGIALYHADALYPYRADRFEGWVPMSSGIANYWSWFTIRPVGH